MAGSNASLSSWTFVIAILPLTALLWSRLISAIVPEPYLVSLAPKPSNEAYAIRMRLFILGRHRPFSAVNGTFGTRRLPLLLACGCHRVLVWQARGLIPSQKLPLLMGFTENRPIPMVDGYLD